MEKVTPYKKEIVLLRAVAIISVVIYHSFPAVLPLGYLGVDIFFVISGYLMLEKNIDIFNNKISIIKFYNSRIKRIIPAVYILLIIVTIVSFFILLPGDFIAYAVSMKKSLIMDSNYYFYESGGYFGGNDSLKPLLHLWSLCVEMQFYLIIPFIIYLIKIFSGFKKNIALIILIITLSYLYNYYYISSGNQNAAFFFISCRLWEFSIGMLISRIDKLVIKKSYSGLIISICLINIFIFLYFEINNYINIIIICILTAIIILYSGSEYNFKKYLCLPILMFIGNISFSLYLLHWPLVSFFNYYYPNGIPYYINLLYLLLIIPISYLYFKYIEFSLFKKWRNIHFYLFFTSILIILAILSRNIILEDGYPSRFSATVNSAAKSINSNFRCMSSSFVSYGATDRACTVGDLSKDAVSVVLLGNSHAQMYGREFDQMLKSRKLKGLILPLDGCLPFIDYNLTENCLRWANENFNSVIADRNISTVIIASTWYSNDLVGLNGLHYDDTDFSLRLRSIEGMAKKINYSGKSMYLIGPIEIPSFDFASSIARQLAFRGDDFEISRDRNLFDSKFTNLINSSQKLLGNHFLPVHQYFCNLHSCYFAKDGQVFFADSNHLSLDGAARVSPSFSRISTSNISQ